MAGETDTEHVVDLSLEIIGRSPDPIRRIDINAVFNPGLDPEPHLILDGKDIVDNFKRGILPVDPVHRRQVGQKVKDQIRVVPEQRQRFERDAAPDLRSESSGDSSCCSTFHPLCRTHITRLDGPEFGREVGVAVDLHLECHETVDEGLRSRRTSRDVDIYW